MQLKRIVYTESEYNKLKMEKVSIGEISIAFVIQ